MLTNVLQGKTFEISVTTAAENQIALPEHLYFWPFIEVGRYNFRPHEAIRFSVSLFSILLRASCIHFIAW